MTLFLVLAGCASGPLKQARSDFYGSRPDRTLEALLNPSDISKRDRLLFYMEKRLILHHAGEYEKSIATLLKATALIKQQDIISASEQAGPARMVTTDVGAVLKESLNARLARILAKETALATTKEVFAM